jgi:hypothetical protein
MYFQGIIITENSTTSKTHLNLMIIVAYFHCIYRGIYAYIWFYKSKTMKALA